MNARPDIDLAPDPDRMAWVHGVVASIGRRWWLMPVGIVAGLLLATLYLHRSQYSYSAQLKVYAAPSTGGKSAPAGLGGLAALTGLAAGSGEAVSPFRFYLEAIYSPEVANRLARDPVLMRTLFAGEWDPKAGAWRQPASVSGAIRSGIAGLLGLPKFGWQPPDATRLQQYITDTVSVRQSVRTPIVVIGYDSGDPAFATRFLTRLHETVDGYLRQQQVARTRGNIDYLAGKLETVTLAEQRQALVVALTEQERQAMLAYGNAPYAAEPFDVATASLEPTRPRPIPLLGGAAAAGLVLGIAAAVLLGRRDQRMLR